MATILITKSILAKMENFASSKVGSSEYKSGSTAYCQRFVGDIFSKIPGVERESFGSARACFDAVSKGSKKNIWYWGTTKDVPVGAAVYFSAPTHNYGHAGWYAGNDVFYHVWGAVKKDSLRSVLNGGIPRTFRGWVYLYQTYISDDLKGSSSSGGSSSGSVSTPKNGGSTGSSSSTSSSETKKAEDLYIEVQQNACIGSLTPTIAIPTIPIRSCVSINGVGDVLSGKYYVSGIDLSVSKDGISQDLTLRRTEFGRNSLTSPNWDGQAPIGGYGSAEVERRIVINP